MARSTVDLKAEEKVTEQIPKKETPLDSENALISLNAFAHKILDSMPQRGLTHIPDAGWRWQYSGTGKYKHKYYQWVKGSGKNRQYRKGGKVGEVELPTRPGRGNRKPRRIVANDSAIAL